MDNASALLPLLGVVVGGGITFGIQYFVTNRQREWDEKKIKMDNYNKMKTQKFTVFSQILYLDSKHNIAEWSMQFGYEFHEIKYNKYIRPVLYEIYHLLDETIVNEIEKIEKILGRQRAHEEAEEFDNENLITSYKKILELIKEDFKDWREFTKNEIMEIS
ncbi:hypothetical protein [Bacillus cereus]|uniref:hypothetical protein n=1 Tax=Bacillus cereus TaxID=1396 RepID=UPI001879E07A|nr:hypothetical protein [Bacillus cereus]MBE7123996.1 hypothetical protein [Bacillus cereus]